MSDLSGTIKMRREELALTQEKVAKKAGIKQQSYQATESDKIQKPRFLS